MDFRRLLEVGYCADDETGCYEVGGMDFGVPPATGRWLDLPGNRERLSLWLHKLAGMVERSQAPFEGNRAHSARAPGSPGDAKHN